MTDKDPALSSSCQARDLRGGPAGVHHISPGGPSGPPGLFHLSGAAGGCQRAAAAFFAISLRFLGESLSARTFPPLIPPRRPSSRAAVLMGSSGSSSAGGAAPVSSATT